MFGKENRLRRSGLEDSADPLASRTPAFVIRLRVGQLAYPEKRLLSTTLVPH